MLESLTIKNTAIIDRLTVNFGSGMNCLTGETGAGKSIIIDSICCLLGERVSRENIRRGCDSASVQGLFNIESGRINELLEEMGVEAEEDGTLILFREYTVAGKNTCRINGQAVTLSMLKKIGECLVDVHGQHDNHSLLSPSTHLGLLDLFAGDEMLFVKERFLEKYAELKKIDVELESLSGDPKKRAATIDLLTFQAEEIEKAALKIGEDEELEKRRQVLANAERIAEALESAYSLINGEDGYGAGRSSVTDVIGEIVSKLEIISEYNESYKEILSKINEASYLLEDASKELRTEKEEAVFDPQEVSEIDSRLDEIYKLKRKYGDNIEDIIAFAENAVAELARLESSEELCRELTQRKNKTARELRALAAEMHTLRVEAVEKLEGGIHSALEDMEMGRVRFQVSLEYDSEGKLTKNGLDSGEFMICTNPGESFKPLSKIASGGELSRIMLAVKSVLADIDEIPVLIFDEIDTGISGYAATKVAEKFKSIAVSHQVICVSHLAQIAAIADENIFISKEYIGDGVSTKAALLDEEEKIREVSRLLDGGDYSEVTKKHAEALIARMRNS